MGAIAWSVKTAKSLLRRVLPARILKERNAYQRLGPKAGPIYLKMRLLDMTGLRRGQRVPGDAKSIVFVCFGNIMRSAMSAASPAAGTREKRYSHSVCGPARDKWNSGASLGAGRGRSGRTFAGGTPGKTTDTRDGRQS